MRQTEWTNPWLEALESGEYVQGQERLVNLDNDTYCCLGVAAKVMGELDEYGYVHGEPDCDCGECTGASIETALTAKQEDMLGISDGEAEAFVHMNDTHGFTFVQIAEVIRDSIETTVGVDMIVDGLVEMEAPDAS